MRMTTGLAAASLVAILASPVRAEQPAPDAPTAEEQAQAHREALRAISKALTDPVSETWSVGLQSSNFRIDPGLGRESRWSSDLLLTGAFPIAISPDWNFITRTSMFLLHSQPHPQPHDPMELERTTAFGDIVLLQLLAPSKDLVGGWLLGAGPAWIFPSGTSRWTTTGKWQVGPAAVVGYLSEKWILGALVENFQSFAGSGPNDTNAMNIQPIAGYFFHGGWSVGYSGNILANFNSALPEDRWTVPIGVQVGKVTLLGTVPVKIALDAQWMPVHPDRFGQTWSVGLVIQAVRPKLLRGYLSDPSTLRFRWEP